jgi:hypothetical protein
MRAWMRRRSTRFPVRCAVPDAMRPSSSLKAGRLQLLATAFARRALRQADVAALLDCSPSGARNYLNELMDAGVITVSHATGGERSFARRAFVLHPDGHRAAQRLLAPAMAGEGGACVQRRDPLVAALFGAA